MSFIARCLILADPALPGVIEGAKQIPTFADSFDKADAWPGAIFDFPGEATFTTADFADSFDKVNNWPGAVFDNPGEATFTTPDFTDSYEAADSWPGAT